ncbi:type I restriction endonuclease [Microvirga arabica]|uniref:type I restriction endonuclease n=1 Tax=Microvirga arabica TaxID=1128671 RepID=UPI001FE68B5C|nr:type I restriction enzyme HsdR N-terminal domain-containing protein [Microvirga arabica]
MSVEEKLRILAERVKSHSSAMITEEAVKTAVILPFLSALDYDVFNPHEVIPEYTADAVGKKGEKVDYAIKVDGAIRILIECKPISTNLDKVHLAQLYRYFSVTEARFAILTNGRTFHFHTDLEAPNKLDERPFLTFDLSDLQGQLTHELKKFAKSEFSIDNILQTAHQLKYTSAIKKEIVALMEAPSEDFVRLVTANLQLGRFTAAIREQFTPMVKTAFREIIRDSVQARLSTALADTEAADVAAEPPPVEADEIIATTEEEREGFMIVRAIIRDILKPARVVMRDQKSYCGILVDDNNRRPLARLHFNRSVKYIGLFDGEKEERVKIDTLDEIYEHAERLRATAQVYSAP